MLQFFEENGTQLTPGLKSAVKAAQNICVPFQVGKSHLTKHFNSAAQTDTPFTNQIKCVLVESVLVKNFRSHQGLLANIPPLPPSITVKIHPLSQITPSAQTVSAGCPAQAPCQAVAVQTLPVGSWPPPLANSRKVKEVTK